MENKRLIINAKVDGNPIRYNVKVSAEVAEKYAQIRKENPEMEETEAMKLAREITE